MPREDLIQYRRGAASEWAAANPVLANGEVGFEYPNKIKIGNGTDAWNSLSYVGGGALSISAGASSGALASLIFQNGNGITFGLSGSSLTASVAAGEFTASSLFRQTSQNSQLQFTSANSNFLGSGASASFRHTSQNSQLQFTSQMSDYVPVAAVGVFRFISQDSQLQFTSANSNFLGAGATASFRHTSADSQLQFTSANSNLLGSAATQSFRHTSADSQLQFTSANSNLLGTAATASFQFTSDNSLSLGTGATASFRFTSQNSQLQFTSANSNLLGTAATQSFQFTSDNSLSLGTGATASFRFTSQNSQLRFTSADSQLQFTSANSNLLGSAATQSFRHTSADSQLQFTSANTNFAQGWQIGGNSSGTSSSAGGSRLYFEGGQNITLSGNGNTIVVSGATAAPSPVGISAGGASASLGNIVFSNSNSVSFGLNGSTITASIKNPDLQYFELDDVQGMGLMTNIPGINTRPIFVPFILKGNLTNNSLIMQVSRSTSGSNAFTLQAALYSFVNSTSIARMGSLQNAFSGSNTASFSGVRYLVGSGWEVGVTALTPGNYVLGLNFSANGGNTASMNYSLFGGQSASQPVGFMGQGSDNNTTAANSSGPIPMWGRYSVGSAGLPANVAQSDLLAGFTGASQPLAPWFVLKP